MAGREMLPAIFIHLVPFSICSASEKHQFIHLFRIELNRVTIGVHDINLGKAGCGPVLILILFISSSAFG
jgi:hypothetical protein